MKFSACALSGIISQGSFLPTYLPTSLAIFFCYWPTLLHQVDENSQAANKCLVSFMEMARRRRRRRNWVPIILIINFQMYTQSCSCCWNEKEKKLMKNNTLVATNKQAIAKTRRRRRRRRRRRKKGPSLLSSLKNSMYTWTTLMKCICWNWHWQFKSSRSTP